MEILLLICILQLHTQAIPSHHGLRQESIPFLNETMMNEVTSACGPVQAINKLVGYTTRWSSEQFGNSRRRTVKSDVRDLVPPSPPGCCIPQLFSRLLIIQSEQRHRSSVKTDHSFVSRDCSIGAIYTPRHQRWHAERFRGVAEIQEASTVESRMTESLLGFKKP